VGGFRLRARPLSTSGCGSIAAAATSVTAEAILAWLGLAYLDVPALELGIVELLNRLGRFLCSCHFDEAETLRLAGKLVHDHGNALHLACL